MTEFNPRVFCPHCNSFLEFVHPPDKCLEPSCPNGCTLSSEDKAAISTLIIRQHLAYFKLENPIDVF